jgi:chromosomal replication initiator protein
VRYIHAQEYFDEMVRAIQRKTSEDLKHYYQSLDLLLIDDIQFLSGKPRTQEEFFYTFDALYAARKQIIITCDTYPKEITGIEERLISRFDSGLIVAIEPPELEMRVAILLKKADQQGIRHPRGRRLLHRQAPAQQRARARGRAAARGRVSRASAASPISLDLAKEALEDLLALNRRQISVEFIQKTVADFFKIKVAEMYGKRRHAHIVLPRQVAMYLAKELTQKSLPEIGEAFGGRDHTTVLHAMRKIAEQRQHDRRPESPDPRARTDAARMKPLAWPVGNLCVSAGAKCGQTAASRRRPELFRVIHKAAIALVHTMLLPAKPRHAGSRPVVHGSRVSSSTTPRGI